MAGGKGFSGWIAEKWDGAFEGSDAGIGKITARMKTNKEWLADRGAAAAESETMQLLGKGAKGAKKMAGRAGLFALAAGAVVAAPFVISGMRKKRAFSPDMMPPPPPMPEVMEAPMMQPQGQTLMGQQLVTDGPMAQRVMAQRGMGAGLDTGNPGLMDIDGTGQAPQSLGR